MDFTSRSLRLTCVHRTHGLVPSTRQKQTYLLPHTLEPFPLPHPFQVIAAAQRPARGAGCGALGVCRSLLIRALVFAAALSCSCLPRGTENGRVRTVKSVGLSPNNTIQNCFSERQLLPIVYKA